MGIDRLRRAIGAWGLGRSGALKSTCEGQTGPAAVQPVDRRKYTSIELLCTSIVPCAVSAEFLLDVWVAS
jgi:hypothetical protein